MTSTYDALWKRCACWLAACAALIGLGNFVICAVAHVIDRGWIAYCLFYLWMGVGFAQGGLHSVWCVFAPVRSRTKISIAIALPVFWCGTAFLGSAIYFARDDYRWSEMAEAFSTVPLLAIAIQAPLWLVRFWYRWRILHPGDDPADSSIPILRIRHIMLAVAGVALVLGAARWGIREEEPSLAGALLGLTIVGLVFSLVTAAIVFSLLVVTLRTRCLWRYFAVALAVYLVIVIAYIAAFSSPPLGRPPDEGEIAVYIVAWTSGFLVCFAGILILVRSFGYRLEWGLPEPQVTSADDTSSDLPGMRE